MTTALDLLIIGVTWAGFCGYLLLAWMLWSQRHHRGGMLLLILVAGFAIGFAWTVLVELSTAAFGAHFLTERRLQALVGRGTVALAAWIVLGLLRWRRPE